MFITFLMFKNVIIDNLALPKKLHHELTKKI